MVSFCSMKFIKKLFGSITSHSLTKHSIAMFMGVMVANVLSYLYHLLIGRILGPVSYGEFAALFSLFYILNVPSLVLQTVVVKYFSILKARGDISQAKGLFLFLTKTMATFSVIGFVLFFPFISTLSSFLHITHREYFVWLYFVFASYLLSTVNAGVLQAYQLFIQYGFFSNVGVTLRLFLGLITAPFGVGWALLGNLFSSLLGYMSLFAPLQFLLRQPQKDPSISSKSALGYTIPTFFATLGLTMLYSQDVMLVKHFLLASEAGVYSSLSVLGKIVFYASSSFGMVVFPIIAERHELKKNYQMLIWGALAIVGITSFSITTVYYLFPKFVVLTLFGSAYIGSIPYLGKFGVFISFFSLSSIFINIYLAIGKTIVGFFTMLATLVQILLIVLYHENLNTIITMNIFVTGALFVLLLSYYLYEQKNI